MNVLVVNTASERVELALSAEGKTAQYTNDRKEMASIVLLSEVEKLTKNLGITLEDIDIFSVVIGPGSFTGIRIGVSTVRGFCQALKKRAVAVNRLELLAYISKDMAKKVTLPESTKPQIVSASPKSANTNAQIKSSNTKPLIVSVVDGQNGVCYLACYSTGKSINPAGSTSVVKTENNELANQFMELISENAYVNMHEVVAPMACRLSDLGEYLAQLQHPYYVVTDFDLELSDVPLVKVSSSAQSLLSFTELQIAKGLVVDYPRLEPLYIRKSQAERGAGEL